jgi:ribosomal protein L32E
MERFDRAKAERFHRLQNAWREGSTAQMRAKLIFGGSVVY